LGENPFAKRTLQYQPNSLVKTIKQVNLASNIDTSNFMADSPEKLVSGMDILHIQFGKGKITEISGEGDKKIATIDFNGNIKKIMLKYAKVKIV
jgi:hypothetical protein